MVVLYGSETWIRKVDSDRIQSFHVQALRRILDIRWHDKVSNAAVQISRRELSYLIYRPSLIADRRHSLFGHLCRLPKNTRASQALQLSIDAHTGTPAAADCMGTITGSSKENVAVTSRRGLRDICWSRPDHKPRSLVVEIATTLSWSSAAVSERVIHFL